MSSEAGIPLRAIIKWSAHVRWAYMLLRMQSPSHLLLGLMKRSRTPILLLAMLVFAGCTSTARMGTADVASQPSASSSELHTKHSKLAKARQLEHRARAERRSAARAKRTARRLQMGTSYHELSAGTKARISREKRKARSALRNARRLEREARALRSAISP